MKTLLLLTCFLIAAPAQASCLLSFLLSPCQRDACNEWRQCRREVKSSYQPLFDNADGEDERSALLARRTQALDACKGNRYDDFDRCRKLEQFAREAQRVAEGAASQPSQ